MESILSFFEEIPSSYRTIVLASGLLLFWIVEGAVPLFRSSYPRFRHAAVNIVFTLTTMLVNFGLAFLIVMTADWVVATELGAMQWLSPAQIPLWLSVIVGIMILDLVGAWLVHWVQHNVRWMWRFHLIHHTDQHIDVTSALRHHPIESVFRAAFTIIAVVAAGAPIAVVFIYQTVSALWSQFIHANFQLPKSLDRVLSWVLVTPDMHKVHHHYRQPYSDTNYGNIFSLWDHAFRTFAEVGNTTELIYGIETHMDEGGSDDVVNLMLIPFQPYRERPESEDDILMDSQRT